MNLLKKIGIALLSTLIFSILLAFWEYVPVSQQEPNSAYTTFSGLVILYSIYALPIYLLGGVLYSYIVDSVLGKIHFRSKRAKYITSVLGYGAGGLLIVGIILGVNLIVDGSLSDILVFNFFILGAVAALVFFHISLALNKVDKKSLVNIEEMMN